MFRYFAMAIFLVANAEAVPTCFNRAELAGVIFGSIAGTVIICGACFAILAFCTYKHKKELKNRIFEKAHGTLETDETISTSQDFSEKGITTDSVFIRQKVSMRDKETEAALPTPLPRRKGPLTPKGSLGSSQRSQSLDALRNDEDKRREKLELELSKFGFSIGGDEHDGIFIDRVIPGTPAELSGNIFSGDKIKTLTIGFDEMSYDEALTILALVTEHTIRLDLERIVKADEQTQTEGGEVKADMRLPWNLLKSFSMNAIRRKLEACKHRNFGSLEGLNGPALPKIGPPQENIPFPNCKHCFEEERIIKVVRHLGGKIRSHLTVTSESSEEEEDSLPIPSRFIPPGHGLIRAEEFDKKIKNSMQIESRSFKISSIPSSSGASSGSMEEETESSSTVHEIVSKTTRIISSEATIQVKSETQIQLESAEIPLPIIKVEKSRIPLPIHKVPTPPRELTPPLPPPPAILMPEDSPKIEVSPELPLNIDTSQKLSIISPKMPAAALTPDFVEVRAQKFHTKDEEKILDRKLPEIPSTALRKKEEDKQDPGQMYLKIRNGLREVYTGSMDDNKSSLSIEQCNTLEKNRRKLEEERQQLRQLGIM